MNLPSYTMKTSMRNIIFIAFSLIGILQVAAQNDDTHRERIKSLKAAYITDQLNLTSKEAQDFWPIYNLYQKERRKLYRREHAEIQNIEKISEQDADKMLLEYVKMEQQDYVLLRDFYRNLRKIFPAKRIIHLKKVEDDFNHRLLKEYRERNSKKDES